ncbi:MAG: restriction endonuclease [Lentisphaerae bacterium]|nr:restriction endonuclease [Lentisphaerota bacterium]
MSRTGRYLYEIELGGGSYVHEERGKYVLRGEEEFPTYDEIASPDDLRSAPRVANALRSIDWSFTTDDTGFLTHDLHPYPAKFIPQIPGNCIAQLSLPGELVLDPFGGSGTTALEAVRLGRRALSTDANAVGTLIGRVKTCNLDRTVAKDIHAICSALTTRVVDLPDEESLCLEHAGYIPDIPNIDKWFPITSRGELALIRSRIARMESDKARDVALLALSRIVLAVSFQDSETRYSSKPHDIPQGETLKRFLVALDAIVRNVVRTQAVLRYGVCAFVTADTRELGHGVRKPDSVDLIVTSPPYGNANDYHLYHRFRLLWLGHDPRQLGKIEIGSHLRHQRESSGFDAYLAEMRQCLSGMHSLLRPGRYAVLVVGDAIYKNVLYPAAEALSKTAEGIGFETVCIVEREIHTTKRSFVAAGRRATTEKLLVIRKPPKEVAAWFSSPPYKLWPYEGVLRGREIESVVGVSTSGHNGESFSLKLDPYAVTKARRLVFTHGVGMTALDTDPTWQAIIENGFALQPSARKDPKYVTHGLHPYKGKFYPQLAKGLINLCALPSGANVFDPFCGSGTTLLEGYLNGFCTFGSDMNPVAAKIAKAKVGILDVNPDVVREALGTLVGQIEDAPARPADERGQFNPSCLDEISKWFPAPVILKLNWLLSAIRSVSEGVIRDFLEVVLSSIIREVSQQDPTDLRIRRRKEPIQDADVFQMYLDALDTQYARVEKFWSVRGYSPDRFRPSRVVEGDSRSRKTLDALGLARNTVDLVLTSPPYATALPYIDTDRLSLLMLFGMNSSARRPIEQHLVGSREIITKERRQLEKTINDREIGLPESVCDYLQELHRRVSRADVGFRRKNMPALLQRFFHDMASVLKNCVEVLRPGGEAMIVIGDNCMRVDGDYERIATTDFVQDIAVSCGMTLIERIDISVTTENLVHIKHAITENVVLRLKASRKCNSYQA